MLDIKDLYSKFSRLMKKDNNKKEEKEDFIYNPRNIIETKSLNGEEEVDIKEEVTGGFPSQEWLDENEEGQLSVDVYQTDKNIIVKSTIAGVKPEDLDISIHNDMLTIRGKREHEEKTDKDDYFYRECYWGNFSRSIILPVDVLADRIEAIIKNGVLTITLPKAKKTKIIKVKEIEE